MELWFLFLYTRQLYKQNNLNIMKVIDDKLSEDSGDIR